MSRLSSVLAAFLACAIAVPAASASTGGCTEVFFQSGYMGEDAKQVFNDDNIFFLGVNITADASIGSPVPEPSTYVMAVCALLGLVFLGFRPKGDWRRRRV